MMHVVGGLYKELCTIPQWSATFGSGGRAAAVISGFCEKVVLHTYTEEFCNEGIVFLTHLNVEVVATLRPSNIVFAYFHPLSRPFIQPNVDKFEQLKPINVSGDAVLRFGFIEGDSIVTADRAVYDPQTWRNVKSFSANGSVAKELAIVLNELELKSATKIDDLDAAAAHLLEHQGASIIVAKGGIRGATVFERGAKPVHIPCYRSSRIFKIGTGDIFSAMFSYYWAEEKLPVSHAADLASRSVAAYCSNYGQLPFEKTAHLHQVAWNFRAPGVVKLEGAVNTIGQRYTMEEARFALRELGVEVLCPALGDYSELLPTATLILADGFESTLKNFLEDALKSGKPIVILCEGLSIKDSLKNNEHITFVDDFSSSLYSVACAASEH
jgi:hypothetical protein